MVVGFLLFCPAAADEVSLGAADATYALPYLVVVFTWDRASD